MPVHSLPCLHLCSIPGVSPSVPWKTPRLCLYLERFWFLKNKVHYPLVFFPPSKKFSALWPFLSGV